MGLYADSGGSPSTLITAATQAYQVTTPGWFNVSVTSTSVTAGTYYWIALQAQNTLYAYGNVTMGGLQMTSGWGSFPSTFSGGSATYVFNFRAYNDGIGSSSNGVFETGDTSDATLGMSTGYAYAEKFVTTSAVSVSTLAVNVRDASNSPGAVMGIYSDNSGVPGTKLAQAALADTITVNGWHNFTIPTVNLASGTTYWIVSESNKNFYVYGNTATLGRQMTTAYGTMPTTWVDGGSTATFNFRAYAGGGSSGTSGYYETGDQSDSSSGLSNGYMYAEKFTATSSDTIGTLAVNIYSASSTPHVRMGLYSDSGGVPSTLIGGSSEQTVSSTGWSNFTIATSSITSGSTYWIVTESDANLYAYDNVAQNGKQMTHTYGTLPGTWSGTTNTATFNFRAYIGTGSGGGGGSGGSYYETGNATDSTTGLAVNHIYAEKITLTSDAGISTVAANFWSATGNPNMYMGIYSDNAGVPGNLLATSTQQTVSSSGWVNFTIPTVNAVSGTVLWIAAESDKNAYIYAKDTTTMNGKQDDVSSFVALPSTWTQSANTYVFNFRAYAGIYTPPSGGSGTYNDINTTGWHKYSGNPLPTLSAHHVNASVPSTAYWYKGLREFHVMRIVNDDGTISFKDSNGRMWVSFDAEGTSSTTSCVTTCWKWYIAYTTDYYNFNIIGSPCDSSSLTGCGNAAVMWKRGSTIYATYLDNVGIGQHSYLATSNDVSNVASWSNNKLLDTAPCSGAYPHIGNEYVIDPSNPSRGILFASDGGGGCNPTVNTYLYGTSLDPTTLSTSGAGELSGMTYGINEENPQGMMQANTGSWWMNDNHICGDHTCEDLLYKASNAGLTSWVDQGAYIGLGSSGQWDSSSIGMASWAYDDNTHTVYAYYDANDETDGNGNHQDRSIGLSIFQQYQISGSTPTPTGTPTATATTPPPTTTPPLINNNWNSYTGNGATTITPPVNTTIEFRVNSTQDITTWSWTGATPNYGNGLPYSSATMSFNAPATYYVSVSGTNPNGTTNTITWNVVISGNTGGTGTVNITLPNQTNTTIFWGSPVLNISATITSDIGQAINTTGNLIAGAYNAIANAITAVANSIAIIPTAINNTANAFVVIAGAINNTANSFSQIGGAINNTATSLNSSINNLADATNNSKSNLAGTLSNFSNNSANAIGSSVGSAFGTVGNGIASFFSPIGQIIYDIAYAIFKPIIDLVNQLITFVKQGIDFILSLFGALWDLVVVIFSFIQNFFSAFGTNTYVAMIASLIILGIVIVTSLRVYNIIADIEIWGFKLPKIKI